MIMMICVLTDTSGTNGVLVDPSFGNTVLVLPLENKGSAETYGIELAGSWEVTDRWKLSSAYSFISMNLHLDTGAVDSVFERDEGRTANNIYNLRSTLDLPHNMEWDNAVYYVDNLSVGIDNYIRVDTRFGWKPFKNLELSVVGQNLFDDWHQEFDESIYATPSENR